MNAAYVYLSVIHKEIITDLTQLSTYLFIYTIASQDATRKPPKYLKLLLIINLSSLKYDIASIALSSDVIRKILCGSW